MFYSLESYNEIAFKGFDYKLSPSIQEIIVKLNLLVNEVNSSVAINQATSNNRYKKSNNTSNQVFGRKPKRSGGVEKKESDWESLRVPFKSTTIVKKQEGIEKILGDIRLSLNKLSNKNYDTQSVAIIENIKLIYHSEMIDDDRIIYDDMVTQSIFDTAINNKFYSELYTDLLRELLVDFPFLNKMIIRVIEQYKEGMNDIQFVDQNLDYDMFCQNNKRNDKRKSMATFIVNLMKNEILEKHDVIEIILYLQELITNFIDDKEKVFLVDEITENIFIFVSMMKNDYKQEDLWCTVVDNITLFSNIKVKEKAGFTSRAMFKYKDLLDLLSKK